MSNVTLVHVTPQLAKEWLCKNNTNRALRDSVVERYARMMKSHEWTVTHQGVAFDVEGNLVDGQHRLAAVLKSGQTIPFLVCRDLSLAAYAYIDGGVSRSIADRVKLPPRYVDVLNCLFRITFDYGRYPTPTQLDQMDAPLAPVRPLIDGMARCRKTAVICAAPVRSAAVYAALAGEPANEILAIYGNLADGEAKNLQGLAAEFLRLIVTGQISSRDTHGSMGSKSLFFKTIPVFQRSGGQRKRFPPVTDELMSGVRTFLRHKFRAVKCDSTQL